MSFDGHQQKCYHPSLQELNTKPDNVILTSMYPRSELVPELDSQSMVQLQLVPSGVVIVRVKTVSSLPFYSHSRAFPASTFSYTVFHAVQNMKGPVYLARSILCQFSVVGPQYHQFFTTHTVHELIYYFTLNYATGDYGEKSKFYLICYHNTHGLSIMKGHLCF